jgi:hypothetical protein
MAVINWFAIAAPACPDGAATKCLHIRVRSSDGAAVPEAYRAFGTDPSAAGAPAFCAAGSGCGLSESVLR